MDMKVILLMISATMIYTFSIESIHSCPGINETSCCPEYRWNLPQQKCIPFSASCEKGYNGTDCSMKCPYPTYGQDCQSDCNCIDKDCDHRNGCNRTKGRSDIPSSLGLINTSLTSEYVTSKVSFPKNFPNVSISFSSTATFITTKQEIECKNFLMFATIGLIVVALIVVVLFIYTWMLEKRFPVSRVI